MEIILAIFLFGMLGFVSVSALIYGSESTASAVNRNRASQLANEGLEAVRNIASVGYSNLSSYSNNSAYYLTIVANHWDLITTPTLIDNTFSRIIVFSDGPSGSRQATVTVSWPQSALKTGVLKSSTYLANWQAATTPPSKTGLFIYANGSTTTDKLSYRIIQTTGIWTDPADLPDIDSATTNRVARSIKIYSAQTGSAKMLLSRHFNGSSQFIYGTYWNGSSFSTPQLLVQWSSNDWLDAGNFSGSFMANGTFVAVYNDNTNIPKYRTFNGTAWSAQGSLPVLGNSNNFPTNIVVKGRPGANEAMAAILSYDYDTNTSFFANGSWSDYTKHGNNAANNRHLIDFDWSPVDPTKGALLYSNINNDRSIRIRTFNADGQGSGGWNPVANGPQQSDVMGSVSLSSRTTGAVEYMACDKDTDSTPNIYCYKAEPQSNGISTPANSLITSSTDPGDQISFSTGYELKAGLTGLIAYSDNTTTTKLKLYDSNAASWSANPLSAPAAAGIIQKTKVAGQPFSNDSMIIVADAYRNLYSIMYNGTSNTLYASPSGKAWTSHNASGPANTAVWFDFAWDN